MKEIVLTLFLILVIAGFLGVVCAEINTSLCGNGICDNQNCLEGDCPSQPENHNNCPQDCCSQDSDCPPTVCPNCGPNAVSCPPCISYKCYDSKCIKSNSTIKCYKDADCGTGTTTAFCSENNAACLTSTTPVCLNPGIAESQCSSVSSAGCSSPCKHGCKDGACISDACKKECKYIGTKSEGWYDSCTGKLIEYADCDSEMPTDMEKCLDNSDYYWDQETDSCKKGYSKDMIRYSCSDPDNGRNYYEYAHTFGFRSSYADDRDKRIRTGGADGCTSENQLVENYCDENGFIQTEYIECSNGCKEGECIKGEKVGEKITCKFENTKSDQKCYIAGEFTDSDEGIKFCKAEAGSGSCVISYEGYKGEKVTWKSSCGQYQYTTQDGSDEVIYFKCSEGEIDVEKITNKGFRSAYWQCYDGDEQKLGEESSCKLSETWQKYAKEYCKDKCKGEKCGVNSFSVSGECYSDEMPSSEIDEETSTKEESILSEDILICKDSCPLDKKCYPFGYRKDGKFCSDIDNKFISQLKSDEKCDNNFECTSNVCVAGKCIDEGFIQKIINWFKTLFGGN